MTNELDIIRNKKVRQSNNLIESPYAQEFTAHEIKLFEIAVAGCSQDDIKYIDNKSDKEFYFSNSELAKLLNTKPNVISMEIENTAKRIMKKMVHLRRILDDGTIEFELINIVPYARYKDGLLKFRLNYAIIPYLLEINKNFTEYQLHYLLEMNSSYAIKLYKLLYQYRNLKSRVFLLDDLKEQFGIQEKYKQYNDLKKYVINPSISQINTKTDLIVNYNEIKMGRKVAKIEFLFNLQKKSVVTTDFIDKDAQIIDIKPLTTIDKPILPELDKLLSSIESELSEKTKKLITKMHKEKGIEYIEASIKYATKNSKSNFDVYLHNTLTKGWAEVELQKILDKKTEQKKQREIVKQKKQEEDAKLQAKKQNKLAIKAEWNNLADDQRAKYDRYATNLINKYNQKLSNFPTIIDDLPLCCYAVSQNKSYDLSIEGYCKTILQVSLSVVE